MALHKKDLVFILVPGLWHTSNHMLPLMAALKQHHCHNAIACQLHSVGRKTSRPTFDDDVKVIYNEVAKWLTQGNDVCLVLHSFAGIPGAEAVNRLKGNGLLNGDNETKQGGLVRVVFIAAFALPAGVMLDAKELAESPDHPNFSMDSNDMIHMSNPAYVFFNRSSEDEDDDLKLWLRNLDDSYYLGGAPSGPMVTSDDWRTAAPITALLCRQDNANAPAMQELMWQGTEIEWIDAPHTSYLTHTDEVAQILARLVNVNGKFGKS